MVICSQGPRRPVKSWFDPYGHLPLPRVSTFYLGGLSLRAFRSNGDYEVCCESGWNVLQVTGLEPGTYTPSLEMTAGHAACWLCPGEDSRMIAAALVSVFSILTVESSAMTGTISVVRQGPSL